MKQGNLFHLYLFAKNLMGFFVFLNLKRFNEVAEYKKFKMETIFTIMHLVSPGMFIAKLDVKDAYYSVPICEDHQSLLKFQYQTSLFKFTALPNGYTEGPSKFTKLIKPPLAFLRKIEEILVAGYFDDLITMNSAHSSCCDNISKIISLLSILGFAIHPEKSPFNPCQEIEYLEFVINSINMTVSLTPAKIQKILSLCVTLLAREHAPIRQVAQLLGTFSSSFIAMPFGKLYYRSLERCKTKSLVISKGHFDKIMHVSKEAIQDILWWKHNIVGAYAPIVRENPSVVINTDASSFGWGHHYEKISFFSKWIHYLQTTCYPWIFSLKNYALCFVY